MQNTDTKQAEKDYLTRTGSSVWERTKPFSPPTSDTLDESAHLLHDFAAALLTLQPSADDLLLDLGAGGCWCSDLLARLNRSSIAVDISLDMLRAGRARPGVTIRAVAGDMESLPFRSGTFQKAICLSAIHHVPAIPRALAEIARVLDSDGVAFFSEPGEGHGDAPVSGVARRDYGVLEQDILAGPFMRHCRAAGFESVAVQPLSYTVPGVHLSVEQWEAWARLAESRRPRRAVRKLWLAVAELFGMGKQGALFEEALAVSMVRTLRQVVTHHPIIVARKRQAPARAAGTWRASIGVRMAGEGRTESLLEARVHAKNQGERVWRPSTPSGTGHVTLGIQLLDETGHTIARDFHRVPLPHSVGPGETAEFHVLCPMPSAPARYRLKFDLVAEGVTWFELTGSTPAVVDLTVR